MITTPGVKCGHNALSTLGLRVVQSIVPILPSSRDSRVWTEQPGAGYSPGPLPGIPSTEMDRPNTATDQLDDTTHYGVPIFPT